MPEQPQEKHIEVHDFRGQSFKGKDCSNYDFRKANIRGVDFSNAKLSGAKFNEAVTGLRWYSTCTLAFCSSLLSLVSGIFIGHIGYFFGFLFNSARYENSVIGVAGIIIIIVFVLSTVQKGLEKGIINSTLAIVSIITILIGAGLNLAITASATLVIVIIIGIICLSIVFVIAKLVVGIWFSILIVIINYFIAVANAVTFIVSISIADNNELRVVNIIACITVLGLEFMSLHISKRISLEDERYLSIRDIAIAITSAGGTSFRFADLTHTDFTQATLENTDFRDAILACTRWYGVKRLDSVRFESHSLTSKKIRDLVLTGDGYRGDFSNHDLSKIDLTNANLEQANFAGANLSSATLRHTNLSGANLSKAQLDHADLTGACLTGVHIEDWLINSKTKLDDVICEYVYLKQNKEERRPSSGSFSPGELTLLFQKALETVDLIFADGIDWKAFFQSFQELRSQYGDESFAIQAIEKKTGDAFVIRLEVPLEADKALIESQAKELYERERQLLETQYRERLDAKDEQIEIYKQQSTNLLEIVRLQASRPINPINPITITGNQAMGDRTIHTDGGNYNERIEGNYIQGSYFNTGQDLTQAAQQIQDLLQQLQNQGATVEDAQQRVATDLAKQAATNPSMMGKLVLWSKAMANKASETTVSEAAKMVLTLALKATGVPLP